MKDKLTNTEIKVLQTLKDNPDAKIIHYWPSKTSLYVGKEFTTLSSRNFDLNWIRPALIETYSGGLRYIYTLRPDAEISNQWLQAQHVLKLEEYKREREQKVTEEEARRDAARESYHSVADAILTGEVDFLVQDDGIYFTYQNQKYVITAL